MQPQGNVEALPGVIKVVNIPPETVAAWWPWCEERVERALLRDPNGQTLDQLRQSLEDGDRGLTVVFMGMEPVAAMTFELLTLKDGTKTLHGITIGGVGVDVWHDAAWCYLSRTAKELGCEAITMKGRPGWSRLLAKHGWDHEWTVMRRSV